MNELIDKNNYYKNNPRVKAVEKAVVNSSETGLLAGLAILFYNWGNNIDIKTKQAMIPQQKEAQYLVAVEKFEKSLFYDKNFAEAIHNKTTAKLELIEMSDKYKFPKNDLMLNFLLH